VERNSLSNSQTPIWDFLPTFGSGKQPGKDAPHLDKSGQDGKGELPLVDISVSNAQAAKIVADAESEAERLLHDARLEAEGLQYEAQSKGYAEGYEQAKVEVEEQLQAAWDDRVEGLKNDLKAVIASIESERSALWKQTEKEIVSFSIEIAQKIVKTEVQQNPRVIGEVIKHALRRVVNKEHIRIRINPQDIDSVRSSREDLLLVLDGATNLEIVDDRRIQQGGCVVETTAGNIDSNIDTQFERITSALEVE